MQHSSNHAQEWLLRHTASRIGRMQAEVESSDSQWQNTVLSSKVESVGAGVSSSALAEFEWAVEPPLGQYPDNSKMLTGEEESYVISPLGNIVDEMYTAYFDFKAPSS